MKLVVGLGNPGREYERTRHNVGFLVAGEFARRCGAQSTVSKFDAEIAEVANPLDDAEKIIVACPQTYMNESGRSVGRIVDFYSLELDNLIVVCDDLNLDTGRLRLRPSGSDGGQKGLRNIIQHLGTNEFPRLRVGIGHPPGKMPAERFVLARFNKEQTEVMEIAIVQAADAIEAWLREGITNAMNIVNAPSPEP